MSRKVLVIEITVGTDGEEEALVLIENANVTEFGFALRMFEHELLESTGRVATGGVHAGVVKGL